MCAYTGVEKNSNKTIDAILRTDNLNKSFVQIRNADTNTSRNFSLAKSVEPIGNPLSNSASKVKSRIIYTKSISILKPTTAPINKNLDNNEGTPTRKFHKPDYLNNKSLVKFFFNLFSNLYMPFQCFCIYLRVSIVKSTRSLPIMS